MPDFLHQLAGSAGMYGYTEIADAARNLIEMHAEQERSGQDRPAAIADMERARDSLIRLLRAAGIDE
jgi:HPt (histidine-containing phosphotransfer) domain-containing protein